MPSIATRRPSKRPTSKSRSRSSVGRSSTGSKRSKSGSSSAGGSDAALTELQPQVDPPDVKSFRDFDLDVDVLDELDKMGIHVPTPIQALAVDPVLKGRDVIAKAETGTGKTLAFGAPIVSRVDPDRRTVLALIMCPTRELAQQVADVLTRIGNRRGLKVVLLVGGEKMPPQIFNLRQGAQIVVGTPGRLLDLYEQRYLTFPWTDYVVLDEADRMLEIGFLDDINKILSYLPPTRQTLLFSATFPPDLLRLARNHTREPVELATASGYATVENIDQRWIPVRDGKQSEVLQRLFDGSAPDDVFIVFCPRRLDVNRVIRDLKRTRHSIEALHGGYDQAARFAVMNAFRTGNIKALIATDVAARGLDITHVTHVINLSVPRETAEYTHRIGRTGRAGRSGQAITFVNELEITRWNEMREEFGGTIERTTLGALLSEGPRPKKKPEAKKEVAKSAPTQEAPAEKKSLTVELGRRPRKRRRKVSSTAPEPEVQTPKEPLRETDARAPERRTAGSRSRRPSEEDSPRRGPEPRSAEPRSTEPRSTGPRDEPPRRRKTADRDEESSPRRSRPSDRDEPRPRPSRSADREEARPRSSRDREVDQEPRRSTRRDEIQENGDGGRRRPARLKPTRRPKKPKDWDQPLSYENAIMGMMDFEDIDVAETFEIEEPEPRRAPRKKASAKRSSRRRD